jgi:hypothetical protein
LARARLAALKALPEAAPQVDCDETGEAMLARLKALREAGARARERLAHAARESDALKRQMATLLEESHGHCPTCGSAVDAEMLLTRHTHRAEPALA